MNISRFKILQANNYFYLRGGTERHLDRLINLLKKMGHEVIVFSAANMNNWPSPHADFFAKPLDLDSLGQMGWFEKVRIAPRIIYSVDAARKISSLVDVTLPDMAHCHNIYGILSPSILHALKKKGVPVVMSVHDVKLLCPNHRMYIHHALCERCKINRFYQCAINKCIGESWPASFLGCIELYVHRLFRIYEKNVDAFIAPSKFYRLKLLEYGFPDIKVHYIPNLVDIQNHTPTYEHEGYAIYFGRLEEVKGLNTLLNAAAQLNGVVKFVIVGSGPMEASLKQKCSDLRITNVDFFGEREGEELKDLVRNALFSVVPSEWYENAPYTILESYSCGKAVIGSDIGGIPELIEDGRTGFLFRPKDADDLTTKIKMLIKDKGLAARMGQNAREKVVNEFNPDLYYSNIISLYKKLI